MAKNGEGALFDRAHASSYDAGRAKMEPMRRALHYLIELVLAELPEEARILCVGAGTGAELLSLARTFPGWRFTAVDPAGPMLAVARARAEEQGCADRCRFHEGYLSTLPEEGPFDAATSVLVSHFLVDPEERRAYYRAIAARLRPGGLLVSADLSSDPATASHPELMTLWSRMLRSSDMPKEEVTKILSSFGTKVALLPPGEIESMLRESGFMDPVRFYQALLIHAWRARTALNSE